MRKLSYHIASTVDGYIADATHGVSAFTAEGDHVTEYMAALKSYDTIVMGRRTYEFGLRYGVTDPYPWAETVVFTRSMSAPPSPRVKLVADDAPAYVRQLKDRDGSAIYLCGGGELARTLFDAGLIDEVIIKLNPALLGGGIPLAPGIAEPKKLRLRSTKVHDVGVVVLRYDVQNE